MSLKQTYIINNSPVTGEPVKVESTSEPWAEYTLADGSKVKAKLVLIEAIRLDTANPENGDPLYQFQFQNIVGVAPNPDLRKPITPVTPDKPIQ
ncbi:MAG: hypothetical protein ACLGQX_02745 [Acidobacteriota bacterium]